MVRKEGKRGKTRSKFKRKGSKPTVNTLMKKLEENDTVQVVIDSSKEKRQESSGRDHSCSLEKASAISDMRK